MVQLLKVMLLMFLYYKLISLQILELAYEMMGRIEQRLQFAFLLNASVQRQAERVTATEVQLIANELNDALGGVYGILTTEFQLPYINTKVGYVKATETTS